MNMEYHTVVYLPSQTQPQSWHTLEFAASAFRVPDAAGSRTGLCGLSILQGAGLWQHGKGCEGLELVHST